MALYGARLEYALHTLVNPSLSQESSTPSARDLAEFQRLPHAFMRKLLTQLEKAGLVVGSEGLRGGWRLARSPAEISVLAVADATQDQTPLFECRNIRTRCALWSDDAPPRAATAGVCSIHAVMLGAEAVMRRELARHTLADLAGQVKAKASPGYLAAAPRWFTEKARRRRAGGE